MRRERGQALIEVVVGVPACLACALVLVDCGVVVADRIAVTQAAGRAAHARLVGADAERAARSALPTRLRRGFDARITSSQIRVRVESRSRIAQLAGRPLVHTSTVHTKEQAS